jgi:hypothetical protein
MTALLSPAAGPVQAERHRRGHQLLHHHDLHCRPDTGDHQRGAAAGVGEWQLCAGHLPGVLSAWSVGPAGGGPVQWVRVWALRVCIPAIFSVGVLKCGVP